MKKAFVALFLVFCVYRPMYFALVPAPASNSSGDNTIASLQKQLTSAIEALAEKLKSIIKNLQGLDEQAEKTKQAAKDQNGKIADFVKRLENLTKQTESSVKENLSAPVDDTATEDVTDEDYYSAEEGDDTANNDLDINDNASNFGTPPSTPTSNSPTSQTFNGPQRPQLMPPPSQNNNDKGGSERRTSIDKISVPGGDNPALKN